MIMYKLGDRDIYGRVTWGCVFWSEVQPKGKVALKVKEGVQWHGLGG